MSPLPTPSSCIAIRPPAFRGVIDRVCVLGKPGRVYEPFWDECGGALTAMGMGGMDEMGVFVSRSVAICVFF